MPYDLSNPLVIGIPIRCDAFHCWYNPDVRSEPFVIDVLAVTGHVSARQLNYGQDLVFRQRSNH